MIRSKSECLKVTSNNMSQYLDNGLEILTKVSEYSDIVSVKKKTLDTLSEVFFFITFGITCK